MRNSEGLGVEIGIFVSCVSNVCDLFKFLQQFTTISKIGFLF